jgi:serine/threonine protein kinase
MSQTLSPDTTIAQYKIVSKIGEGGMGEVWRARDTKLGRDVAIKVLPAAFAANEERLRRFEQEAQAAGALNHPNILVVYHIGTHEGAPYVVTELLEGESLRDRLNDGAITQRKAVDYAVQIAHGLAAAHEKGIVHRDLKPDNLFITNDDRVKILDFGLAKLVQTTTDIPQTEIATRRVHTDPGTVMGTAGYMSPEQVRGRAVDHRSDIFSFGAVLYEMLAGKRAFRGDSAVETLNAILKEEPQELTNSNPNVAPALERVVWHCLEKSPDRRFQSATDIAFALESLTGFPSHPSQTTLISPTPTSFSRTLTRERLLWLGLCALLSAAALAFAYGYYSQSKNTPSVVRLALATPEQATFPSNVTISPDGSRVVFIAVDRDGQRVLWVRSLDSLLPRKLEGTEGAVTPFWSPDSNFVGYFANQKLFKVDASGGRPQALCDSTEERGGAWNNEGTILFAGMEGLYRVSAQGGTPTLATKLGPKEEAHRWPYFLPDGRHFIFLADAETKEDHHIRIGSLDSQETQILFNAISRIAYSPPGYLLYVNQGSLVAQAFDANTRKILADPKTVVEHVAEVGANHEFDFSISNTGVLAYQSGNSNSQLTWFDRSGKKVGPTSESRDYGGIALSPDGQRAATSLLDSDGRVADIWLVDLGRDSISRLTFDPSGDGGPVWSPDGSRIVFSSNRLGGGQVNIYQKAAGGAGDDELLFTSETAKYPTSWSSDGRFIVFDNWALKTKGGVWLLSLPDKQAKPLLQASAYDQFGGRISPDGRFVAYSSNESGRVEVYVQPVVSTGEKWRISTSGGAQPFWRGDGKELYYVTYEGRMMSADISTSKKFESSVPRQLFQTNIKNTDPGFSYAATADGQRFLVNTYVQNNNVAPMTIVLNWTGDLKK